MKIVCLGSRYAMILQKKNDFSREKIALRARLETAQMTGDLTMDNFRKVWLAQ